MILWPRPAARTALPLALALATGCGPRRPAPLDAPEQLAAYADLPGLQASHDPELQAAWARLVAEEATPRLLAKRTALEPGQRAISQATARLLPESEARRVAERAAALLAKAGQWDEAARSDAARLARQYADRRRRMRALAETPGARFPARPLDGPFADLSFVRVALCLGRLEALEAAVALPEGGAAAAIEPLMAALRIAELLAAEYDLTARLAGARLRCDALLAAQAAAARADWTGEAAESLALVLDHQLADWPPDQRAWIGERAQGLVAYELARDGGLLSLLSDEQIERLRGAEPAAALAASAAANADRDQRFYLEAMRRMIAACAKPYFARREMLGALRHDLDRRRGEPDEPLLAGLLLEHADEAHRLMAADRSLCEAWSLALAAALGRPRPPRQVSPLSGEAYRVATPPGWVFVDGAGGPEGPRAVRVRRGP